VDGRLDDTPSYHAQCEATELMFETSIETHNPKTNTFFDTFFDTLFSFHFVDVI